MFIKTVIKCKRHNFKNSEKKLYDNCFRKFYCLTHNECSYQNIIDSFNPERERSACFVTFLTNEKNGRFRFEFYDYLALYNEIKIYCPDCGVFKGKQREKCHYCHNIIAQCRKCRKYLIFMKNKEECCDTCRHQDIGCPLKFSSKFTKVTWFNNKDYCSKWDIMK